MDQDKILFLDIETVPQVYLYKDLDAATKELWDKKWQHNRDISPEQHYLKAGIYAEFAKVVCIGVGYFSRGKFTVSTIANENETLILKQFSKLLTEQFNSANHALCAHNGKEFDFPFLCRRFLINNIPLPGILRIQGLKPWEVKHIDTLDLWKFGDYKHYTSLNLLAHVFGIPSPKDTMDGSMVAKAYYEEKALKKIADYCIKDVVTLARVYRRFTGGGELNEDQINFM